jgi:hypothetical protein
MDTNANSDACNDDAYNEGACNEDSYNNDYINQLTLNFLISKTQLQKLKKIKEKELDANINENSQYDKHRITELFNTLLNNKRPDDLLEDVKTCFDAFIEKSIYYLEIHDKNVCIQNERDGSDVSNEYVGLETCDNKEDNVGDYVGYNEELDEDEELEDEELDDDLIEEYFEEPVINVNAKSSQNNKNNRSKGVDDIQKLPLDWFNTTRQNYKINQIIPRKKEIIIDNSNTSKNTNKNNLAYQKKKI